VAEKRSVLTSMQQVLQSCHALLDSTQVPMDSIVKLLQHILRWGGGRRGVGRGMGEGVGHMVALACKTGCVRCRG
jgi:hypothetical protein